MTDSDIENHGQSFNANLAKTITVNIAAVLARDGNRVNEAYARLTALQAIRVFLLEPIVGKGALGFYTEAQGDGLTSQVLLLSGASRSALKSLRSLIENVIRSIYYADHPIEYRLWEGGQHRPTFRSFFEYIELHPDIRSAAVSKVAAQSLYAHWKSLSEAVHASAKKERMSSDVDDINIWKTDAIAVGQWQKFHKSVIQDVCILYLSIFRASLDGAKLKPLR